MRYTVVIPVFNKVDLTRQCLQALASTLPPDGEVVVIDNGSSDSTPQMLADFSWVRAIRNETNRGFAGACNQGAAEARGDFIVHLNNDTVVHSGWLDAMLEAGERADVGVVGARLIYQDQRVQHAGVVFCPARFGMLGFVPFHWLYESGYQDPEVMRPSELQAVTGACLGTKRALFLELGGFDETYWNGYEDVDYCLKVRERGLRVVYEPGVLVTHFESQSGVQRMRRVLHNMQTLSDRWRTKVDFDQNLLFPRVGHIRREYRAMSGAHNYTVQPTPQVTIFLHGPPGTDPSPLFENIAKNVTPVSRLVWNLRTEPPEHLRGRIVIDQREPIAAARTEMEKRGERYLVFIDARTRLQSGWLDELIRQVEFGYDVGAATFAPELGYARETTTLAVDARCTLLTLRRYPAHERLGDFDSLDGALADLALRAAAWGTGYRGALHPLADVAPIARDASFETKYDAPVADYVKQDLARLEQMIVALSKPVRGGLASIVTLSWNAPQFTRMAIESIRARTQHPYEIIVVDNGSGEETLAYLATLSAESNIRIIYNKTNMGFARGCNQGIAAAKGDYIVLLNNDVVVTDGWLEGLIDGVERSPAFGVSAPRAVNVAGDQAVTDADYNDMTKMHAYATARKQRYRGQGYISDRIIGFCMCIKRRVLEEIGGIDERFGVGNFEDDDFSVRVRAAGYGMFVCDDVFIHHFGNATFIANNIDYGKNMRENWLKFSTKWGMPEQYPENGYDAREAIAAGFDRTQHYVALPEFRETELAPPGSRCRLCLVAAVQQESDWNEVGNFVKKFIAAFSVDDEIKLALWVGPGADASAIGARVEKLALRGGIDPARCPDIMISDEGLEAWRAGLPRAPIAAIDPLLSPFANVACLTDKSPSGIRRYAADLHPAAIS